jgi:hypothetical protein
LKLLKISYQEKWRDSVWVMKYFPGLIQGLSTLAYQVGILIRQEHSDVFQVTEPKGHMLNGLATI